MVLKTTKAKDPVLDGAAFLKEGSETGITNTACYTYLPPATKLRQGNVFTRVCDSVHRDGLCPSIHYRSHDQGGLCPGGSLSRGVSVQGGLCPGGSLSWGVSLRETPLDRDLPIW